MPELPEITVIAGQMNKEMTGKRIAETEVKQPKILNVPPRRFAEAVKGKTIDSVSSKGKWVFVKLRPNDFIFMNLGMGAELVRHASKRGLPQEYHFRMVFRDGTGFTARFWWFGYIHFVEEGGLGKHKMTSRLGISPMEKGFTENHFKQRLTGRKVGIKSFLIDQKNIAGIGNVYIQDILFRARLHPNRRTTTLTEEEIHALYKAILRTLSRSIKLGGLAYERDFYGHNGRFTSKEFLVGYKEGKPCPTCGTTIEKIKTGSTATYICPRCQAI
jgi:formamidopyrimidine-DNA glycosylase